ncbi:Uncharacterized conserved protein, DUF302 family [Paenibacillus sp. cl141a]|uniref:DUF302 domain-containing protein n=1 Tax=Paenibacillus sp. cl141a TaxID=1761877 RepID=UPI0008B1AF30|nr:DUF302 domain-containing protein [Paenibacillus sp. cl141a]SEL80395.1 Uncharacterized conserved protein, DUF302 family [Paenibacillus sp. cl141a]
MFHYTVETDKSVDDAIAALEQALAEEKFGLLWRFSIQDKLNEKGIEFDQKYEILEVCNPVEAKKVLSENNLAGYFLPCKLAVYEFEGGTKIGLPRPSALIGMVENGSFESLRGIVQDVE